MTYIGEKYANQIDFKIENELIKRQIRGRKKGKSLSKWFLIIL
jgi:hypothetical protein